ncbi:hypothetical protein F4803DRAFT_96139 [Xylaria telfairii]|nr:hypothetical protein F4803DRAFT_96139 [Xylaria telfairii]
MSPPHPWVGIHSILPWLAGFFPGADWLSVCQYGLDTCLGRYIKQAIWFHVVCFGMRCTCVHNGTSDMLLVAGFPVGRTRPTAGIRVSTKCARASASCYLSSPAFACCSVALGNPTIPSSTSLQLSRVRVVALPLKRGRPQRDGRCWSWHLVRRTVGNGEWGFHTPYLALAAV